MIDIIKSREEAGAQLASLLSNYKDQDAVVLAVPRGGVPVGRVIANELNLPLDIVLSKKIGHPVHEEYAVGAVSLDESIINTGADVPMEYFNAAIPRIREELEKKYRLLKGDAKPIDIKGKVVLLIDDGVATGITILSTIRIVRKQDPVKIILAVPVIAPAAAEMLKSEVDSIVALMTPENFRGVAQFYENFKQVSDEEVISMLRQDDETPVRENKKNENV